MKIKAVRDSNKIVFDNFVVIPESDNFFGIYEKDLLNQSITSGITLQ